MEFAATVRELYVYPIKSCGPVQVQSGLINKFGLAAAENPAVVDRKWMVINENNSFISQRTHPRMALIQIRINGDYLLLSAPDMDDINVPVQPPVNKVLCKCKDQMVYAHVYNGEVADWLSKFLGEKLDLACFSDEFEPRNMNIMNKTHQVNLKEDDATMYSDYSQYMLMSEATVKDLNTRTPYRISFLNFRPNFMVDGCDGYAEDNWNHIRIGDVDFRRTRHCTRCLLTTVDPETGVKDAEQEPLKTLRTYRLDKDVYGLTPMLGINLAADYVDGSQRVSVGDKLYIAVQ